MIQPVLVRIAANIEERREASRRARYSDASIRLSRFDGHDRSAAMTAHIIDGAAIAKSMESGVAEAIARLGFSPGLVAVRVGNDPASEVYVRSKAKKARELGLSGVELIFPETLSEADLLAEIA